MAEKLESPLSEADTMSLNFIFNSDPENISDAQLEVGVAALRSQREIWLKAEASGAKKGAKPPKLAPITGPVNPEDLGL